MVFRIFFFALVIGLLQLTGVRAEDLNPVVGKAGDFSLREADVERLIGFQPTETQKVLQDDPAQRAEFVRQLILTRLVAEKARAAGFDRKPDVKEQVGYLIDQFLAREYMGKVVAADVTVPEQESINYYKEHEKEFLLPEQVKARHIFIEAAKETALEARAKARSKADEALARLRKGEEFSGVARELSQDADTAAKGGDLGWISPGRTNSEEFEKALFLLKTGETSNVVETPFGFHVLRVDERREKRTAPFDEARVYIMNRLKVEMGQKKIGEYLDKLSKDAGLEVKPATSNK